MIDQNQLKDKIRNTFFELVSDIASYSQIQLLERVSSQLQEMLHVQLAALYTYNNWEQTYESVTDSKHHQLKKQPFKNIDIAALIKTNPHENYAEMVFENTSNLTARIIFLQPSIEPSAFLILAYPGNHKIESEILDLIGHELESLLKIINFYNHCKEKEERSTYLFELTNKFYSVNTKKNILTEITKAVDSLYPIFKYNILLSQDYEEVSDLPIKTIEYTDGATKIVSTQAFISGEVQLEDRMKEKKTCLYAPFKGNQGVYGVLQIITPHTVNFPQNEIEFIARLAGAAGQAIESVTLYQNSKHLVKDLKLINEATNALNANLNIAEITSIVRQKIIEASNADQVGIIYTGETQDQMINILSGSTPFFFTSEGEKYADVILNQTTTKKEALFSGDFTKEYTDFPFPSLMAIPMLNGGMEHGGIIILQENKYAFSFDNFKLMQSLVHHFTLSLTNSILNEKLKEVAITDHLTQLFTRNHLEEGIQQHLSNDEKGALIIVDIDDFKEINDTYGHHVGDKVLVQIASIINSHTGENDVPARWGGEELAIYLSNATIDEGVRIATQIRKQTENFTNPKVTLSCGVAIWDSTTKAELQDLFIRADNALYSAKKTGKNCVVKEKVDNPI